MLAKKLRNAHSEEDKDEIIVKIREIDRKKLTMSYSDPFDASFKRLQYVRYADDFLIGVIGSKEDAIAIKEQVKAFQECPATRYSNQTGNIKKRTRVRFCVWKGNDYEN